MLQLPQVMGNDEVIFAIVGARSHFTLVVSFHVCCECFGSWLDTVPPLGYLSAALDALYVFGLFYFLSQQAAIRRVV